MNPLANTFAGSTLSRDTLVKWIGGMPGGKGFVSDMKSYAGQDAGEIKLNADTVAINCEAAAKKQSKVSLWSGLVGVVGLLTGIGLWKTTNSEVGALTAILTGFLGAAGTMVFCATARNTNEQEAQASAARQTSIGLVKYAGFIQEHSQPVAN